MDKCNPVTKSLASNASNFHFFQFQKLLSSPEEFFYGCQTVDNAVKSFENEVLLKLPRFDLLFIFVVSGKFCFEFFEGIFESSKNFKSK